MSATTTSSSLEASPILDFFRDFRLPPLILAALIGVPSCLLYMAQVAMLLGHWREFNSSFFKLFVVRAIPSIWNMFSSYWSFRLPLLAPTLMLPLYKKLPCLLLLTFFFTSYYTFHVENVATLFLILNRLTSIVAPFRHSKIWSVCFPVSVALIFLLPVPFCYGVYGLRGQIFFLDNSSNTTFSFVTPQDEFHFSRAASISAATFIVLCTLLNLATILAYRRHQRIVGSRAQQSSVAAIYEDRMEAKLTKYAAITFLCQLSVGFCFLSMFVTQQIGSERSLLLGYAIFNFYALINDICTLAIPAWSMLWASSKMHLMFRRKMEAAAKLPAKLRGKKGGNGSQKQKQRPSTDGGGIRLTTINVRTHSLHSTYNLR